MLVMYLPMYLPMSFLFGFYETRGHRWTCHPCHHYSIDELKEYPVPEILDILGRPHFTLNHVSDHLAELTEKT